MVWLPEDTPVNSAAGADLEDAVQVEPEIELAVLPAVVGFREEGPLEHPAAVRDVQLEHVAARLDVNTETQRVVVLIADGARQEVMVLRVDRGPVADLVAETAAERHHVVGPVRNVDQVPVHERRHKQYAQVVVELAGEDQLVRVAQAAGEVILPLGIGPTEPIGHQHRIRGDPEWHPPFHLLHQPRLDARLVGLFKG